MAVWEPEPGFESPGFQRAQHPWIPEQSCWAFTTVIVTSLGMEALGQPGVASTF